jgi:RimJ/RimL family protein N-acetyltransferase
MTARRRVEPKLDTASLYSLLRLAGGRPLAPAPTQWPSLFALAERERLLGIIWKKSADTLRHNAPGIAARWRRRAILLGVHAERQLAVLATTVAALRERSIDVVVLKGLPLAQRIYDDYTVRPSLDLDFHVPVGQRAAAGRALADIGWRSVSGAAPEEERFERGDLSLPHVLEVHSTALDDPLLDHVRLPVEQSRVIVAGHELPAHSGQLVPAYLAAHLAKHHDKPLLWALDFFLLWSGFDVEEQRAASAAARAAGLARHLEWAITFTEGIRDCWADAPNATVALRRLERGLAPGGSIRRVARLVTLSESPRAAVRVIGGRIWPATARVGWRSAPGYFLRRAVHWAYRHLVFEQTPIQSRPRDIREILRGVVRSRWSAIAAQSRMMYVFDYASSEIRHIESAIQFHELVSDEARSRSVASGLDDSQSESGCVVGMLDGREVYHVWYVRGDGARLHGAPGNWRPDGRVLFLHDGFTEPAFRARGIHSAALRWMLARERDTETSHVVGVVQARNVAARRAVESAGFRFLGHVS